MNYFQSLKKKFLKKILKKKNFIAKNTKNPKKKNAKNEYSYFSLLMFAINKI